MATVQTKVMFVQVRLEIPSQLQKDFLHRERGPIEETGLRKGLLI